MEVAFDSLTIRRLCEEALYAHECLGASVAGALRSRFSDLWAAASLTDLLLGNPRVINGQMVVDLAGGYMMILAANHNKNPVDDTSNIMWARVSRVKIVGITR